MDVQTDTKIPRIRKHTAEFYTQKGRRPRILVGRMHAERSERELKRIAAALADVGFDIDIHTSVQLPHHLARMAIDNDVHAVGLPGIVGGDYTSVSQLVNALQEEDRADILVLVWEAQKPAPPHQFRNRQLSNLMVFDMQTDIAEVVHRILKGLE